MTTVRLLKEKTDLFDKKTERRTPSVRIFVRVFVRVFVWTLSERYSRILSPFSPFFSLLGKNFVQVIDFSANPCYNEEDMRKITKKILSAIFCGALFLTGAAAFRAQSSAPKTVTAADETALAASTQLLSPQSYEEYLHLNAPSDVAVTGNYTAIADGKTIFLYDRNRNEYHEYAHSGKVSKLQFDLSETLYFLDENMNLYTLDPQFTSTNRDGVTKTGRACTTFLIQENDFYFTAESGGKAKICKTTLSALDESGVTIDEGLTPGPTLAYYDGKLYYTSGRELWTYDAQYKEKRFIATFPHISKISSTCIYDDVILVCSETEENTSKDAKNFFAYSLAELSENSNADKTTPLATDEEGGYVALSRHDEYVYAVKNDRVRQYDVKTNAFTSFEICDRSTSVHRLDDGAELCLVGNKLLIAENGNARIGVYDITTATYQTPVSVDISVKYLASDGETALVANDRVAIVYGLQTDDYGQKLATFNNFDAALTGVAGVYGSYYFTTSDYRYSAQNTEDGWSLSAPRQANVSATLLTSDAYGYLYVVGGGSVYRYDETQFFADAQRDEVCDDFPTGATKISVDYAGNVYALKNGVLQKIGDKTYSLNTPLVYTDDAKICSFAFGIEENITYVLYDENYIATTALLDLPTVKKIAVNGADEIIFSKENAVFEVVESKPNALVVRFDLNTLSGAELFPYISYERRSAPFTALKIGESGQYNVLAVYDEEKEEYFTCLTLKSFTTATDAYCSAYETPQTGYLTNAVSLYKFPYLTDLLTVGRATRDAQITLLGEVEKLDYEYYYAQYEDETGAIKIGYIPKRYVVTFNAAPPQVEMVTAENETDGVDMLWRACYITLGVTVIAVLVDVLILKKRKSDD